jgi:hypothetical protein
VGVTATEGSALIWMRLRQRIHVILIWIYEEPLGSRTFDCKIQKYTLAKRQCRQVPSPYAWADLESHSKVIKEKNEDNNME